MFDIIDLTKQLSTKEEYMLGELIKQRRKEYGYTQVHLARKLSVTDRSIQLWEKNKKVPNGKMLIRLALALDLTLKEMDNALKED